MEVSAEPDADLARTPGSRAPQDGPPELRGPAQSEDGYRVLLSWAEVDPEFGGCQALLATRYNGELLSRPALVMPADGRAGRYVRRLCRLHLARVDF